MSPHSQRDLFSLYLPLALSGILFPLAPPVINAALARTSTPELALAAYAVVLSISRPFTTPLYSLRQVATALAVDRDILKHIRTLTLLLGGCISAVLFLLAVPPLYRFLTLRVMGIPQEIARIGPPVMAVLAATPLLAVGRGYYQGILVRYGKAGPIGTGALGYLLVVALVMAAGVTWLDIEGALLAAIALLAGQVLYLIMVWQPGRRIVSSRIPERVLEARTSVRTLRDTFFFYLPLAVSTLLTSVVDPAIQAGMARLPQATVSLAALPVCISLTWLAGTPLWNLQQVAIATVRDAQTYAAVRRFTLMVSLLMTMAMVVIALPPVSEFVFGTLIGVSGPVKHLAVSGFRWLAATPLLMGLRSLYYGTLTAQGATKRVQMSAVVKVVVLALALSSGVLWGQTSGLHVAVWATLISSVAEIAVLRRYALSVVLSPKR